MLNDRPVFHSKSLNKALEDVGHVFDNYSINIDSISEDIKELEKWLRDTGFKIPVNVTYGAKYNLEWNDYQNAGIFRILFTEVSLENDHYIYVSDTRPLIETSLETRISVYSFLDEFVMDLSDKIIEIRKKIRQ